MDAVKTSRLLAESVSSVELFFEEMSTGALAARLAKRGRKPPRIEAPFGKVRWLFFGDQKRKDSLRQHKDAYQAWIALPVPKRRTHNRKRRAEPETIENSTVHGFLVMLSGFDRPEVAGALDRRGVVVALIETAKNSGSYESRQDQLAENRVAESWKYIQEPAESALSEIPVNAVVYRAGRNRMSRKELALHLGYLMREYGLMSDAERERLRNLLFAFVERVAIGKERIPDDVMIENVVNHIEQKPLIIYPAPGAFAKCVLTFLWRASKNKTGKPRPQTEDLPDDEPADISSLF